MKTHLNITKYCDFTTNKFTRKNQCENKQTFTKISKLRQSHFVTNLFSSIRIMRILFESINFQNVMTLLRIKAMNKVQWHFYVVYWLNLDNVFKFIYKKSNVSRRTKRSLFDCKLSCVISNWQVKKRR